MKISDCIYKQKNYLAINPEASIHNLTAYVYIIYFLYLNIMRSFSWKEYSLAQKIISQSAWRKSQAVGADGQLGIFSRNRSHFKASLLELVIHIDAAKTRSPASPFQPAGALTTLKYDLSVVIRAAHIHRCACSFKKLSYTPSPLDC